jgi:drug/metabolite transporter (DMT)-like permease
MTDAKTTSRTAGVILVVVSAIVFSSAGIFAKGVSADAWTIIFWRGIAAATFTLIYMILRGGFWTEVKAFGKPALFVTIMGGAGTAAFIPAFKLSTVANVALIYAAVPFVAAALSWIFINEKPTRTVLIASLAAMVGVLIIVSTSFGSSQILGDLLAFFMTLMMAGIMVIYRKYPDTTAALPAALSSIILLPCAVLFSTPSDVLSNELPILALFGLVFAVASVTLSEGARRLPSAETALLSILEMPLAPILAVLILSEAPTPQAIVGGLIILCAVVWSQSRKGA